MAFLLNLNFPSTESKKPGVSSARDLIRRFSGWVARELAAPDEDCNNVKPRGLSLGMIAAVVFLLALGVGLLQWHLGDCARHDSKLGCLRAFHPSFDRRRDHDDRGNSLGVMCKRAVSMLRYNDVLPHNSASNTSIF